MSTSHAAEVLEEVDHSQPQVHFKEPEPGENYYITKQGCMAIACAEIMCKV